MADGLVTSFYFTPEHEKWLSTYPSYRACRASRKFRFFYVLVFRGTYTGHFPYFSKIFALFTRAFRGPTLAAPFIKVKLFWGDLYFWEGKGM